MIQIDVRKALASFDLRVDVECRYPVTALFGPSGSGKTTLLHMIAGLVQPDAGEIRVDGEVLYSSTSGVDLPPERRRIGTVFQDSLLFPHMTVAANLRFGFDLTPSAGRRFTIDRIVDLLQVGSLLDRKPASLSGGERQRVSLGRAILMSPRLLLMDEPLASLDARLKERIMPYLRHIRTDLEIPILYVSHSVSEILQLTGQVIVLEKGEVLAHGDFFDIVHEPGVLPVAESHGFENVLPVEVVRSDAASGVTIVRFGEQELKAPYSDHPPGRRVFIGMRANDLILSRGRPEGLSIRNAFDGRIVRLPDGDGTQLVTVDIGKRIVAEVTREAVEELGLKVGEQVVCLIKTHSIRVGGEVE